MLYPAPEVANDPLLLRASVPAGTGSVEFYVNGIRTGTGTGAAPFTEWMMTPGRYELRVIAHLPGGATAEAIGEYEVRAR